MDARKGDQGRVGKIGGEIAVFLQSPADRWQFGYREFVQDDSLAFQPVQQCDLAWVVEEETGFRHHQPERMQFQPLGVRQKFHGGGEMFVIAGEQGDQEAGINPGGGV